MVTKFYSWWTLLANFSVEGEYNPDTDREKLETFLAERRRYMNQEMLSLANELNTVLGNNKLISLTSAATNGIVVTTIAYEERDSETLSFEEFTQMEENKGLDFAAQITKYSKEKNT